MLQAKAIVHGHCHQKAVMKMDAEEQVLGKLGLDFEILDSGCCGMAGSFGFKQEHYETSLDIGNLVLLPAVRKAAKDTLVVADGFSCREQLRQTTDRRGLHLAEVLHLAFQKAAERGRGSASRNGSSLRYPERSYFKQNRLDSSENAVWDGKHPGMGLIIGAGTLLIGMALIRSRRASR
jgi:hypothetical protein